jgi:hypothetical protein
MTETESCIWRGYNDIEEKFITREKKLSKLLLIKKKKKSNMEKTSANFVET